MNKKQFAEELAKLNIFLNQEQEKQLEDYYNLLIEYNNKINLTRIVNKEEVYLKHFYDSLTLIKVIDLNKKLNICDVGSGAGLPGIILKIVFPNLSIVLVDSLTKRINFLNIVIDSLSLKDIKAVHARMEEFSIKNEEKFDLLVSRAVAKTNTILELGIRSLKTKGYFILMKANIEEELQEAKNAINILGLKLIKQETFKLPFEFSIRNIVKFEKVKSTLNNFPRKFSDILKKPL